MAGKAGRPPRKPETIPEMTFKQSAFFVAYTTNGMNGPKAVTSVVRPGASKNQAHALAEYYLRQPAVAFALAKMREKASQAIEKTVHEFTIDQVSIARGLARLAFSDIGDVCWIETTSERDETGQTRRKQVLRVKDWDDVPAHARFAIQEVTQTQDGRISVKLADKRQSMVNLAQVMGLITERGMVAIDPATGKPVDRFQPVVLQVVRKGE